MAIDPMMHAKFIIARIVQLACKRPTIVDRAASVLAERGAVESPLLAIVVPFVRCDRHEGHSTFVHVCLYVGGADPDREADVERQRPATVAGINTPRTIVIVRVGRHNFLERKVHNPTDLQCTRHVITVFHVNSD
jgi:hypothetical protein